MVKCYDALQMVLEIAKNSMQATKVDNEIAKKKLEKNCDIVDSLSDRFCGKRIGVDIDEQTWDIIIDLECEGFSVLSAYDDICTLLESANSFCFEPAKEVDNCVNLKFVFDNIWK